MIAKACLRQGSFAPGNPGIATTGGRSAAAQRRSHICRCKAPTLNTSDPTVMKRAIDMTDDELAAIASGATLHVVK